MELYLILINAAGLVLMLTDKLLSKTRARRIPERTLLLLAALGGSLGSVLGMVLFRHKTRHRKFRVGLPLLLCLHGVLYLLYLQSV